MGEILHAESCYCEMEFTAVFMTGRKYGLDVLNSLGLKQKKGVILYKMKSQTNASITTSINLLYRNGVLAN